MIEHIIFDLDGTLVDSVQICTDILNDMHLDRGSDTILTNSDTRRYISLGGAPMVEALLGPACVDPEKDIIEFRKRYATLSTPANCVFPGVREGLAELRKQGFTLSICSNKPQALCDKVLGELRLGDVFHTVVGGRPGLLPKPATDLMDVVLRNLDVQPHQCIFVGDSELDHGVAKACKIPFFFVTYGYADGQCDARNAQSFDHFGAVVNVLLSGGSSLHSHSQTIVAVNG
jgi:phosphoglycolate phosphatase